MLFALLITHALASPVGEWRSYASDLASTKYAPLDQINAANFKDLQVVWRWSPPDNELMKKKPDLHPGPNEATPLMIGGTLYTSTSLNLVCAIDAGSGKQLWSYDPGSYGGCHRGLAFWEHGKH